MSIWSYDHERLRRMNASAFEGLYVDMAQTTACLFCKSPLDVLAEQKPTGAPREYHDLLVNSRVSTGEDEDRFGKDVGSENAGFRFVTRNQRLFINRAKIIEEFVRVCRTCGWWITYKELFSPLPEPEARCYGSMGALKQLDVADISVPVEEVRAHLAANYKARFNVHPRVFEETVASVFRGLGYVARVTAYTGDDGIDVFLDAPDDKLVGVQVKRYRDQISVDQIRELTGALVINGLTRGIFVTTSTFSSGAQRTADLSRFRGFPIELVDAERFYDALRISQRQFYARSDEADVPYSRYEPQLLARVVRSGSRETERFMV